jgi:hypothetical protein
LDRLGGDTLRDREPSLLILGVGHLVLGSSGSPARGDVPPGFVRLDGREADG